MSGERETNDGITGSGASRIKNNTALLILSCYKLIFKNGYLEALHRPSTRVLTSLDDGHVSGYPYRLLDEHPMNYFRITEIKRNGTIKGEFALAFVKDSIGSSGPITSVIFPDTLRFENGVFKSILEE